MLNDPFQFANVLNHYLERSGYTAGQLARLSDLPRRTIANWLKGKVRKPRRQSDLLKLAKALYLTKAETARLQRAAGYGGDGGNAPAQKEGTPLPASSAAMAQQQDRRPFQAVADLPYFVGRKEELQTLDKAILTGHHRAVIYSIQGMGGVGKTALVARLAYQLRPHFPDGVLWASMATADPMSILHAFAAAYGHEVTQYADLGSRSQVVRTLLAHKRALIVLDNVAHSGEIRPLLPPTNTCAVIITTRRHDLSVTWGAFRMHLQPFPSQQSDSLDLFAKLLGPQHAERETETLAAIADLLGHLPLAIAIAASRMEYEPGWTAGRFLERLRHREGRLAALAYESQSVWSSFTRSYAALPRAQRRFFNALSFFGSEPFSAATMAHVTGVPAAIAREYLRKLWSRSLVQLEPPECYQLHPLLRDYALAQLWNTFDSFTERV